MNMNPNFEVTLTQLKTCYKATCSLFPSCKGTGETEQAALQSLSHSISKYIAATLQKSIGAIFASDNYSHVLLRGRSKKQKRIFSLEPPLPQMPKEVNVVYEPSPKEIAFMPKNRAKKTSEKDIKDLFQELESALVLSSEASIEQVLSTYFDQKPPHPDALEGFGIPLSLN